MVYKVITKNRCCLRYKVIWPYKWYHRTQSVPVLCVEDGVCNKEHPWVWAFDNDKLIYDIFPQHFFTADQGKPKIFGSLCSGRGREIFLLSHFSYVLRGFRTFSPCCVSRWNIMLRGGGVSNSGTSLKTGKDGHIKLLTVDKGTLKCWPLGTVENLSMS